MWIMLMGIIAVMMVYIYLTFGDFDHISRSKLNLFMIVSVTELDCEYTTPFDLHG